MLPDEYETTETEDEVKREKEKHKNHIKEMRQKIKDEQISIAKEEEELIDRQMREEELKRKQTLEDIIID